jgi:hypothetical protein
MGRAPYSTAEWGVEGFCELLAKAPSTGTGRAVPFQCITISQCLVTGGDGNSFVCGIESLNDERFAAAGHYSE